MFEGDDLYEVGYGKPPRETQFKRGKSGNPKGRPKGSKNLTSIVLAESRREVQINGPRGSRKVTKLEATVMQLGNKSAQGDIRASRDFIALIKASEEAEASNDGTQALTELDRSVLENIRRRMLTAAGKEFDEGEQK